MSHGAVAQSRCVTHASVDLAHPGSDCDNGAPVARFVVRVDGRPVAHGIAAVDLLDDPLLPLPASALGQVARMVRAGAAEQGSSPLFETTTDGIDGANALAATRPAPEWIVVLPPGVCIETAAERLRTALGRQPRSVACAAPILPFRARGRLGVAWLRHDLLKSVLRGDRSFEAAVEAAACGGMVAVRAAALTSQCRDHLHCTTAELLACLSEYGRVRFAPELVVPGPAINSRGAAVSAWRSGRTLGRIEHRSGRRLRAEPSGRSSGIGTTVDVHPRSVVLAAIQHLALRLGAADTRWPRSH